MYWFDEYSRRTHANRRYGATGVSMSATVAELLHGGLLHGGLLHGGLLHCVFVGRSWRMILVVKVRSLGL